MQAQLHSEGLANGFSLMRVCGRSEKQISNKSRDAISSSNMKRTVSDVYRSENQSFITVLMNLESTSSDNNDWFLWFLVISKIMPKYGLPLALLERAMRIFPSPAYTHSLASKFIGTTEESQSSEVGHSINEVTEFYIRVMRASW